MHHARVLRNKLVKEYAALLNNFCPLATSPPTMLLLPLLDRLCLSFVALRGIPTAPRSPGSLSRVGFRLLIVLNIVLVLLAHTWDSYPSVSRFRCYTLPTQYITAKTMAVPTSSTIYFVALAFHLILAPSTGIEPALIG